MFLAQKVSFIIEIFTLHKEQRQAETNMVIQSSAYGVTDAAVIAKRCMTFCRDFYILSAKYYCVSKVFRAQHREYS